MITEDQLASQWFQYTVNGPVISPEGEVAEREDFRAVVVKGRMADAVSRLNPKLPPEAVADHAQLIDFQHPERNDFLVVNQFTVTGTRNRAGRIWW